MSRISNKWVPLFIGVILTSTTTVCAVSQTLDITRVNAKTVTASWGGGDVVSSGSNGSITLPDTGSVLGILQIRCNSAAGYDLTFSTPNATGVAASNLIKGSGSTAQTKIPYLLTMDLSGFSSTATIVTQSLKVNSSGISVTATFGGGGNVIPLSAAQANQVKLNMSLGTFDPADKEEGTYTDTLTALVTVR